MSYTLLESTFSNNSYSWCLHHGELLGNIGSKIQTNVYVVYNASDNDFYSEEKAEWEERGNVTSATVNRGHLNRDLKAGRAEHAKGCWKSITYKGKSLETEFTWLTKQQEVNSTAKMNNRDEK